MSYFLSDIAEFKKRNKVKDAILGRTASGRAFRIGSLVSAGGVGTTLLLNKNAVKKFIQNPLYRYVRKVRPEKHNIEVKTAGVAGTAVAIPVGSAYAFGTKKERDRINRGLTSSVRSAHKLSNDVRGWVNTLHRTSK